MCKKCRMCAGETLVLRHAKIGQYFWCQSCDYICKDEKDYISREAEQVIYDQHQNSVDDPRYVAYFEDFIENGIVNYVSKGRSCLDFGSGPTPVLATILTKEYGYHVDIYDKFYAPQPVYEGKQYDLITSTEVVEHLKKPLDYFRLFKSLLKPDGILAIMTQFHPQADGKFINWHYMRDRSHVSFFTVKTMEYIAQEVGFKIIYTDNKRYITLTHRQD